MRLSILMPARMPGNNGTADDGGTPYIAIPARAIAIVSPAPGEDTGAIRGMERRQLHTGVPDTPSTRSNSCKLCSRERIVWFVR